ncbi:MAG: TolC family outer membrane protein [Rhodospirillales bacterium]|nr:TolC family outer membrane protein [Alphaproteobacteria bacterium]MCB9986736.1 TolC family outer membrane protein [Rhodospirillales bacterium]USO08495.1 MAG: TolC family outer membrane protein [Rhodospirillales bacterium]
MSNKFKTLLLCSALSLGISFTAISASAEELSLENAVSRGMITNPEYGVVANNRMATQEEYQQGRGLLLPSVDLRASVGPDWNKNVTTLGNGKTNGQTRETYDYSATLTQNLFAGGAHMAEINRQEKRVESASWRVEETAQLVGLSIVQSYLEVMRQRDLLQIAKDNVAEHMNMLNEIQSGAQAGRSTEADVNQAESRVASARAQEADVRLALRDAESQFIRYTGEKPDILVMPKVPSDQLQSSVDEAVDAATVNSPTLGIYEADADVAWQEYQATKANFLPKVDLQLQGRQYNDLGGVIQVAKNANAQVIANWNIFRGGIDTHNKREAVYRHAQAKENRAEQARVIEDNLRQSWASMVAAGERAKEFNAQADSNAKVVQGYKDQFELDRRTLLDVLDAQNELFVSRSNAVNAQYLEIIAVYRILALEGRLLSTLGVSSPREANTTTTVLN